MIVKYTTALAMVAALAVTVEAGGVCYSPWHHGGSVSDDVLQKDYQQIKQHFNSIRTFHARFGGINVIDSAAKAGLRVAVGVMMKNKGEVDKEIEAVCDGAKRNPGAVEAVYVGNENLQNGGHGDCSAGELVGLINKIKGCTAGTGIKVGTVQRMNEWLDAPGAQEVAAACDVIGANIYPFFTPGSKAPIEKFNEQWKQINDKYPGGKPRVTETGWPRAGSPSPSGMQPSKETAQQFLNDFTKWQDGNPESYYFMAFDTTNAYGGGDYETSFGIFDKGGQPQLQAPPASGNGGKMPSVPAPAPAASQGPNPYTPPQSAAPVSQAPPQAPTQAPAPTPASSQPTPAPTSASPVIVPAKQSEYGKEAC